MSMDNIIELPAETNPLNWSILLHVLKSAASADQQQVETGTKQLQKWETEKGYYSSLQVTHIDRDSSYHDDKALRLQLQIVHIQ